MMPLGAPSISKYGSLVRPDAQIVALCPHCAQGSPVGDVEGEQDRREGVPLSYTRLGEVAHLPDHSPAQAKMIWRT